MPATFKAKQYEGIQRLEVTFNIRALCYVPIRMQMYVFDFESYQELS